MVQRELADTEPLTIERVLLWTFFVVIFVSVLEAGLHKLIHFCKHHHKYYEMLHKVTGELMIVGLIYLIVKLVCYFNVIKYGGIQYYSLDAADMLLFFVALALVLQSLVIFTGLRWSNAKMDSLTITTAGALVQIAENEKLQLKNAGWCAKLKSTRHMRKLLERKVLEVFFHEVHELPMMFSFSKYLREIQDSQIVDLIEIDILAWVLLLILLAGFFASTGELQAHSLYRSSYDVKSDIFQISSKMDDERKLVFAIFSCSLTVSMCLMAIYLKILNNSVVKHAKRHLLGQYYESAVLGIKKSHDEELLDALKCAAAIESEQPEISPAQAIERMREVSEKISDLQRKRHGLFKDNLLVQLLQTSYRKLMRSDLQEPLTNMGSLIKMPLPFSRKFVQFCVRTFLIVNGLYYSMLVACVVPALDKTELPILVALVLPLLLNTFWLAPVLVHKFSLLDGTWKIDPKKLCAVIDHTREVEETNATMVEQIHAHILKSGESLLDIRNAMLDIDNKDGDTDGYIDIEALRKTLIKFGFKLSRHKFHTLVLLKYRTKGTTVKFDDVMNALVPRRGSVLASHESFRWPEHI